MWWWVLCLNAIGLAKPPITIASAIGMMPDVLRVHTKALHLTLTPSLPTPPLFTFVFSIVVGEL